MQSEISATVRRLYQTALEPEMWSSTLSRIAELFGCPAAVMEHVDKESGVHRFFCATGIKPVNELRYLDEFARLSPRIRFGSSQKQGTVSCDYMMMDEAHLRRDMFYNDYLPALGVRYFVAGNVLTSDTELAAISVQRTAAQGHAQDTDLALMAELLPHVQGAFDLGLRVAQQRADNQSLAAALEASGQAVLLVGKDGAITFANAPAQRMLEDSHGLTARGGRLEISDRKACEEFATALAQVQQMHTMARVKAAGVDIMVCRYQGQGPLFMLVRPLFYDGDALSDRRAIAAVFINDPATARRKPLRRLRAIFGLTPAQTRLAGALVDGVSVQQYAETHKLSPNTVYAHLRQVREKVGASRQIELVRRLNDALSPYGDR